MRLQIRYGAFIAAALIGAQLSPPAVPVARAGLIGVDASTVSYIFHYFSDVEGVDVMTHYAIGGLETTHDVALRVVFAHDMVVFPAIEAAPGTQEAVDAITNASRPIAGDTDPYQDFVKIRDEVQGSITYRNYYASYYVSTESDYFAQMVSAGYNHDLLSDNLNVAVGVSYSWDNIQPLEDSDTEGTPDYRRTLHGNLVVTQILTPTTVVRVGGEVNRVRGLQHDPYRNVYVAGANVPELHPWFRDRWDVFLQVNQYVTNRSSVKLDYRYYEDDWGISSHTVGGKLSQYVTDKVVVRYRYRYYNQIPAFFFRDSYTQSDGVTGFRTGDYRLGDYGAHLFGGQALWFPYGARGHIGFLKGAHFVISYERYFNSNNFTADILETGLHVTF